MAVAPDILLTPTPDPRPKAAVSKPAQNTADAASDKGSSFADMYAQEKRPAASERPDKTAKPKSDKPRDAADKDSRDKAAAAGSAADKPAVAEDGKALPADGDARGAEGEDKPGATLDPLLVLGMTGQLPATEAPPLVISSGVGQPTAASSDGDLQKLNALPGVTMALGQGAQDQAQQIQQTQSGGDAAAKAGDKTVDGNARADLSAMLSALSPDAASKGTDGKLAESALQASVDLSQQLPELQVEAKPDAPRSETFAARLESLTQALNTPQAMTSRPVNPLVPGQPVSVQQNGWTDQVVDRVMWMSAQNLKSAEIQMDPADLGRLEVRIHMNADQTQVNFVSANAGVREALESQQHRLRDMFSQQGMGQLDVNVSDQSARGWQQQSGDDRGSPRRAGRADSGDDEPMISGVSELRPQTATQGRGLVDYYA
ncbi:flagellar hook-length control protein FliK [Pseudomonas sp. ZM23]|uniref:Flagellar hook-length control protein FliK n=1 Tax=Pseudomonas triclosanedens TaxID=2961893 RepID=A0ABY7A367_9PSED|nr:flagellar hook-length control protein FliK [Pseudomonas triclosanedens]MCP8464874.1 flagellar hook-length control protein FliK [Pseudomonas triclosanedens]MCP8470414.1 flagellar hook-length control protein FliK [Pseudomonas triclosanedens]MCP8476219.1 flagellar hook-length control protein FliK [Pseudomonas triclosanedens]WAI51548.1 flagellar hook-length control protein FliK [Pseudomonas triclosanedens]